MRLDLAARFRRKTSSPVVAGFVAASGRTQQISDEFDWSPSSKALALSETRPHRVRLREDQGGDLVGDVQLRDATLYKWRAMFGSIRL